MENYINSIISMFDIEIVIDIYLVATDARKCCLLEYANFKNKYTITMFYNNILTIINNVNNYIENKLTIFEENIYPYPRLLICKLNDYTHIFNTLKTCHYKDYEYQLGSLLEMLYPGNDFYNFNKPRITGRILINNICIYAETFTYYDFEIEYCCIYQHLSEKVSKFNNILNNLNISCEYSIVQDDGLEYRVKQINKNNLKYVQENVRDYINDIYNDFKYSKKQLKLIHSFVIAQT